MNKLSYASAAIALSLALSLPALAATKTVKHHYYVVMSASTKKCSVVDKKPDGKTATMVGKYFYKTKAAAGHAMKKNKLCA